MFRQLTDGQASKFLVATLSAVTAGLSVYYGTARWEPVVVMALGAAATYLVPNSQPPADGQGKGGTPARM